MLGIKAARSEPSGIGVASFYRGSVPLYFEQPVPPSFDWIQERETATMDNYFGRDPLTSALTHLLSTPEEYEKSLHPTARSYVRDTKAMFSTAVDVKELPNEYVFVADMPGLKSADIKVSVENENVLTIGGERKRDESAEENTKFLRLERPAGKFLRKFTPSNAKLDAITATSADGVLTITVPKIPPPEPHKPKTIQVTVA